MIRPSRILRIGIVPLLIVVALVAIRLAAGRDRFDPAVVDGDRIAAHIAALTSAEFDGRIAGSAANEQAMRYVADYLRSLGIEPAGDDGSYFQHFSALMPQIDRDPIFTVRNEAGALVHEFTMYEDYRVVPFGYGAGIDYEGDLVLVGHNLRSVDRSVLSGRIVVIESILVTQDKIEYALSSGAAGVLFVRERNWSGSTLYGDEVHKVVSTSDKKGTLFMVGNLGRDAYRTLADHVGRQGLFERDRPFAVVPNVRFKAEIRFPVVETMNVLGTIPGERRNGRTLLLCASADGPGPGLGDRYFPGAVSNVTGIAALLETARVMAGNGARPKDTVIFAAWNAEENEFAGSRHYVEHPAAPLDHTTVIHLDALGGPDSTYTVLASDADHGRIVRSRMAAFAADAGIPAFELGVASDESITAFITAGVPAVMVSSGEEVLNSFNDTAETVDLGAVRRATVAVLTYLRRDLFRDFAFDYLTRGDRLIIWAIVGMLMVSSLITSAHKYLPESKIGPVSVEQLYYHPLADILRRTLAIVIPAGAALFFFVLLVNLPPNGTIEIVNGETVTSYSLHLSVKDAVIFLRQLLQGDAATISDRGTLLEVTIASAFRSLRLIAASLALSLVLGVTSGVVENYRGRRSGPARSLGTLLLASLPDVGVVLAGLWFYVFLSQRFPGLRQTINLKDFVLPLVSLSILPTAYMSRISAIAIGEELTSEYVRHARGKGYSKVRIYTHELLPAAVSSVLDSVPALMTVILTNLIVVEYLFDYKGIIYYLLYFYKRHDASSFIVMSISVAGLYLLFAGLSRLAAHLSNPMKRKRFV